MIIKVSKEDIDDADPYTADHPLDRAIRRAVGDMIGGVTEDKNGKLVLSVYSGKDNSYTLYRLPKKVWDFYQAYMWDELEPDKKKPKPFSFKIEGL